MNDGEDNILTEAHRYSRQAEEAVKKGHWQQAIDKHSRAAQNFRACVGLTSHPAGDKVLQQLAAFHFESAERVRARLQPQPIRTLHFAPQPPLLIHLPPATSIEFAGQGPEPDQQSLELPELVSEPDSEVQAPVVPRPLPRVSDYIKPPAEVRFSPAIINIQIRSVNPIMSAKSQAHVQRLDSLVSQLSLACQSDPTDRVPKEIVHLFISEMRGQVSGLRESFSTNTPSSTPPGAVNERRLEEQVAALERQLAEETLNRRQLQKKLDNAEIVIEKHKKRWKLLKEAANKKESGDFKDTQ